MRKGEALAQRHLNRYKQVLADLEKVNGDCDALARMLNLSPYYTKQLAKRARRIVAAAQGEERAPAMAEAQAPSTVSAPASQAAPRLLKITEIQEMTRLSRASIYNHVKAGTFPGPIKMGKHSRWVAGEVMVHIQAMQSARDTKTKTQQRPDPTRWSTNPNWQPSSSPVSAKHVDHAKGAGAKRNRVERLSIAADKSLVDMLRARQAEVEEQTGLHVSLSQVACHLLRRGLDSVSKG